MAECKNSFILYDELIETFEELSDEDAGQLVKHLFRYVNDQNPETTNPMVKVAFIPIKQQLKRDLKKYENYVEKQKINGKKGGRPKNPKEPKETQITQGLISKPKKAEDVDVDVDVINSKNTIYTKKDFLSDWNETRTKHLKKPSFLNTLNSDETECLAELVKDYNREDIQHSLIGLFKQKKWPNDNSQMASNPKHFLTHFNSYLSAFHDKNEHLYGKLETTI